MIEALGGLAFIAVAVIAVLLSSRRIPPGAAFFLLALPFVGGCAGLSTEVQRAQMRAAVEGVQAHQAWLDCLQQMRESEGSHPLALHPCLLDAMRETDEAVGAANEAIEAMEEE